MLAQGTPNNMSSVPIYTPEWGVKIFAWGNNTTMQKPTLPRPRTTLRSSDFKSDWHCDTPTTPPPRLRCPENGPHKLPLLLHQPEWEGRLIRELTFAFPWHHFSIFLYQNPRLSSSETFGGKIRFKQDSDNRDLFELFWGWICLLVLSCCCLLRQELLLHSVTLYPYPAVQMACVLEPVQGGRGVGVGIL